MAKPTEVKNTGSKEQVEGKFEDLPDFSKWTEHQIGFAPYWKPENPEDWCFMELMAKDERDPEFIRYLCKALTDTKCRRGPANKDAAEGLTGEDVLVKKGECFSISVYYSLVDEFDFFRYVKMNHDLNVPVRLKAVKKVPTKTQGRKVWNWQLLSDPVKRPALEAHRGAWQKEALALKESNNEETAREQIEQ